MKLLNRYTFLLLVLLSAHLAPAQCPLSPLPPSGCIFEAFDVAGPTGRPLTAFCVGSPVRFELCAGDPTDTGLLLFGVLPGVGTTLSSCAPPTKYPFVYTPQAGGVGKVTVSLLITSATGASRFYIRVFDVYGTPPPVFTVLRCPGNFVAVKITDAVYDYYEVAGQRIPRNQSTTVAVPVGATSVTLTGRYNANLSCVGTNSLPVPPPLAPFQTPLLTTLTRQGTAAAGGPATFAANQLTPGYDYTLQLADPTAPGGYRDVPGVAVSNPGFSVPALAPGCYRIRRQDACGGSIAVTDSLCTVGLTGSSALNRNQLQITTDAAAGTTYTVTRNNAPLTTFTGTPPGALVDADVQCGTTYTYRVTARMPGGTSVSNEFSIPTQSSLPPVRPRLLASFNENNVVLLTPLLASPFTAGSSLRYRRSAPRRPAEDLGAIATSIRSQRDSTALDSLRAHPPCYSVRLTDVCNASPESTSTCPALLSATALASDDTSVTLSWTAFTGPDPSIPTTYTLQRLGADGVSVPPGIPVSGNNYADLLPPTNQQILRYRLQISGAGLPAGTFSYSNRVSVTRPLLLTIPTAFTPNGDGLNDVLEVKGRYLRNYTFVVVDRNGQEVFRGTQRSDAWDGTIRGHAPVLGTYVWRFQQAGEDGQSFIATGAVTILN